MRERYRLIKPSWARKKLPNGEENIDFKEEINHEKLKKNVYEGYYNYDFLKTANEAGYNIYFFPNTSSSKVLGYLKGTQIDVFRWVFVDMDLKDGHYASKDEFLTVLDRFKLPPTKVVDSGNGIHAYWKISDLDRDSYIETQLRLQQKFLTDESVYTVLQLMRMPGFKNTKQYGNFIECSTVRKTDKTYTVDELLTNLLPLSEHSQDCFQKHINLLNGNIAVVDSITEISDKLPESFLVLMDLDEKIKVWPNYDFSNPRSSAAFDTMRKKIKDTFERPREEYGDRSRADLALCNYLHVLKFNRADAMSIVLNTEKARSRPELDRHTYAHSIVDKVYKDRESFYVPSLAEMPTDSRSKKMGRLVYGPSFMDCLVNRWRTKQVLGVIAAPGAGKTASSLKIIQCSIQNNPSEDDIYVFVSLEMTAEEIKNRWEKLNGGPKYNHRLYVVANEDEDGEYRGLNLQDIYSYVKGIERSTGKKTLIVVIDHVSIINKKLDLSRSPNFEEQGFREFKELMPDEINSKVKALAKMLDVFIINQSQTTKQRAGDGDVPLNKDAAFGSASFEWYCDFILTIWKPLVRVYGETDLRVMAWQYCKIREQAADDGVKEYQRRVLHFDMDTNDIKRLNNLEFEEFQTLVKRANALRARAIKNKDIEYDNLDPEEAKRVSQIIRSL